MNRPTQQMITELETIERVIQQLKITIYRTSGAAPASTRYAERALVGAARTMRDAIWNERYAKKVARLS